MDFKMRSFSREFAFEVLEHKRKALELGIGEKEAAQKQVEEAQVSALELDVDESGVAHFPSGEAGGS